MKTSRVAVLALGCTGVVAVAVAGVIAQSRPEPRDELARPRVLRLDGRGGQLGVVVQDLDAAGPKAAGSPGVRIDEVDEGSPAAKAGLREGDIVLDVDGDRVRSARQFSRVIQETPDGGTVKLGIVRNGQRQTVDVTPESRSGWFPDGDRISRDIERGLRDLGPRMRELGPRLRELEPGLRDFRFEGPLHFDFDFDMPRITAVQIGRGGVESSDDFLRNRSVMLSEIGTAQNNTSCIGSGGSGGAVNGSLSHVHKSR